MKNIPGASEVFDLIWQKEYRPKKSMIIENNTGFVQPNNILVSLEMVDSISKIRFYPKYRSPTYFEKLKLC